MMWFASIRHQKISCVIFVTMSQRSSIIKDKGIRILHPLLELMMSFTGMSCDTTVMGTFTTLVNVHYLIAVGPAHSTDSSVIISLRPPQFRKTWSVIIGSFSNPDLLWVLSWTIIYYHTPSIATPIQIYVCLQMSVIYNLNSLAQWICCH